MKLYSKLALTVASVLFTGVFGLLQAQNNGGLKLHQRLFEHYEQREIDHFKELDYRQLNWYMTQSFTIDRTITLCSECAELNIDTFDVIRFDKVRKDDQRVRIAPPGFKHPLFLFSKNEVMAMLEAMKHQNPDALTNHDTTIVTCNTMFYDPGGQFGSYTGNNIDTVVTFCASTPGQCIQATFGQFQLGSGSCSGFPTDILIIYDGPDTSSNWVGNFGPLPSNFSPGTVTSTTGCLTFQFITSNCSPGGAGWDALISCVNCPAPTPAGPSCNNVDFEQNSFTGWTGTTGTNQASVWTPGLVPGRHTITTGGLDPCGNFPMVAPGGNFSAQLGNSSVGAESEQILQKFQVTNSNANFTLQYAVVLEDPGHAFFDQPFFRIEVFNDSNNLVLCGYYYVASGQNIPGFQSCGSTVFKPWSFIAIDLVPYIGQNVTVRYTTADCSRTGHYGYAYLDCTCNPFELAVDSTLCPGETAILTGPNGFTQYSWSPNGETTQSITVSQPGTYCVSVSVGGNCATNTLCGTVKINPAPEAEFSYLPESPMILEQMPVCFTNLTTIDSGAVVGYDWNFGDTIPGTDNVMNPCYSYTYQDSFCVRLIAISDMGCRDTVVHCLEVVPDSIFVPNVFTPNGDSHNDIFYFPNVGYINLHCDIYNRWGNKIYSWDGVKNGWNGDTSSGPASDGTYYYVMWAERIDAKMFQSHGFLTLLRNK